MMGPPCQEMPMSTFEVAQRAEPLFLWRNKTFWTLLRPWALLGKDSSLERGTSLPRTGWDFKVLRWLTALGDVIWHFVAILGQGPAQSWPMRVLPVYSSFHLRHWECWQTLMIFVVVVLLLFPETVPKGKQFQFLIPDIWEYISQTLVSHNHK